MSLGHSAGAVTASGLHTADLQGGTTVKSLMIMAQAIISHYLSAPTRESNSVLLSSRFLPASIGSAGT